MISAIAICADGHPSHGSSHTVHHRDVQSDSLKGYSLIVCCLLCFVMRCYNGEARTYHVPLNERQRQSCAALRAALVAGTPLDADYTGGKSSAMNDDWYATFELDPETLDDPEGEEYGDHGESDAQDPRSDATWSKVVENPIQDSILDLLTLLYTQLPTGNDDKYFSPLIRFVITFSVRRNGDWLPPRRITHLLAVLLFGGRGVMMTVMYRRLLQDPNMRYSE